MYNIYAFANNNIASKKILNKARCKHYVRKQKPKSKPESKQKSKPEKKRKQESEREQKQQPKQMI